MHWDMGSVVFVDAYHPYAIRFLELVHAKYGHRAVCVFTDEKTRVYCEGEFPALRGPLVEASYDVGAGGVLALAETLRARHAIAGAIPHAEPSLLPAAEILER